MSENAPDGYEIAGDRLINKQTKEYFLIRNRPFAEIDRRFRGTISLLIPQLVKRNAPEKVYVLDVGGGEQSKSARELAAPNVLVVNADLLARPEDKKENFYPIPASVFRLPFKNSSFDLLYTRQLLTYFFSEKDHTKEDSALAEIVRVLKPGGVAIVDEDYYSYYPPEKTNINKLASNLSVKIDKKEGGLFLNFPERLQKLIEPNLFPPGRFLIMQKIPLDADINRAIEKIPTKLKSWKVR